MQFTVPQDDPFLVYFWRMRVIKGSGVQWGASGIHLAAKLEDAFLFSLLFFYLFLQNYVKDNFNVWEMMRERAVGMF